MSALGVVGDYTVRRVIGDAAGASQNVGNSVVVDVITWGIFIAERDATTAGVFPEPGIDQADWMAYGNVFVPLREDIAGNNVRLPVWLRVDNRSMRKVNENHQDVVLVVHSVLRNVAIFHFWMAGRYLVSHGQR